MCSLCICKLCALCGRIDAHHDRLMSHHNVCIFVCAYDHTSISLSSSNCTRNAHFTVHATICVRVRAIHSKRCKQCVTAIGPISSGIWCYHFHFAKTHALEQMNNEVIRNKDYRFVSGKHSSIIIIRFFFNSHRPILTEICRMYHILEKF